MVPASHAEEKAWCGETVNKTVGGTGESPAVSDLEGYVLFDEQGLEVYWEWMSRILSRSM
jgi:hypothetical protein